MPFGPEHSPSSSTEFGGVPVEYHVVDFSALKPEELEILTKALQEANMTPAQVGKGQLVEFQVSRGTTTEIFISSSSSLNKNDQAIIPLQAKLMGAKGKNGVPNEEGLDFRIVTTNRTQFAPGVKRPDSTFTIVDMTTNGIMPVEKGKVVTSGAVALANQATMVIPLLAVARTPDTSMITKLTGINFKNSPDDLILWIYPGFAITSAQTKKV